MTASSVKVPLSIQVCYVCQCPYAKDPEQRIGAFRVQGFGFRFNAWLCKRLLLYGGLILTLVFYFAVKPSKAGVWTTDCNPNYLQISSFYRSFYPLINR